MPAYTYPRTHRLGGYGTFRGIRAVGVRLSRGPLTIHAAPNQLDHPRLGISIGTHVGIAARRNRIKRLLRESFRLMQHDWPRGFDLVITVKRHEPLTLAEYQKLLSGLLVKIVNSSAGGGT
jgi:ribonuclease P protein component